MQAGRLESRVQITTSRAGPVGASQRLSDANPDNMNTSYVNFRAEWKPPAVGLAIVFAGTIIGHAAVLRVPADHATLQAAVKAAASGDEILLSPGVHSEQVLIENKDLTLSGMPGAVIRAWREMTKSARSGWFNLVEVTHATVTVRGIEFQGEWLADALPAAPGFSAISFNAANGTVEGCTIQGFRGAQSLGIISGVGIATWNPTSLSSEPMEIKVLRNTLADNALGVFLTGDWMDHPDQLRTTFTVEGNTITGIGLTSLGTQYGLVIVCGAGGVVKGNHFAEFYHAAMSTSDSGAILAYDMWGLIDSGHARTELQPLRIEENVFEENQEAIGAALANGSTIARNRIHGMRAGLSSEGVLVSGTRITVAENRFDGLSKGVVLVGDHAGWGTAFGIATNVTVAANRFCGVATPVDHEPLTSQIVETGSLLCPFPPPPVGISPAVLLAWPDDGQSHLLESAPSVEGPWAILDQTPVFENGQATVSVKADGQQRYFRLR